MPDAVKRTSLLRDLADCCMKQGQYHLAAKKYTQAGNMIEAMRALLKSGDTQRIMVFAATARSKEVFAMAGNYLQTTEWKENPDTITAIVQCYTKAGAHASLALFYDACAQVEVDDYRDYEKAAAALQQAIKCTATAGHDALAGDAADIQTRLNTKLTLIRRFLNIRT